MGGMVWVLYMKPVLLAKHKSCCGCISMGGTFQATARFQDSGIFQRAIKMAFRCILSVNYHLSGFKL